MSKNGRVGLVLSGTGSETSEYEELERAEAHRNRRRQMKQKTVRALNRMLAGEFDGNLRKAIIDELNHRYGNLYKLRMKG